MKERNGQLAELPASGPTGEDRRRSPRQAYTATAWISAETGVGGSDRTVAVADLSLHGVGFTSDDAFEPDGVHWIVIGLGMLRASSRLRIISCRKNDLGTYDCGAEFF